MKASVQLEEVLQLRRYRLVWCMYRHTPATQLCCQVLAITVKLNRVKIRVSGRPAAACVASATRVKLI